MSGVPNWSGRVQECAGSALGTCVNAACPMRLRYGESLRGPFATVLGCSGSPRNGSVVKLSHPCNRSPILGRRAICWSVRLAHSGSALCRGRFSPGLGARLVFLSELFTFFFIGSPISNCIIGPPDCKGCTTMRVVSEDEGFPLRVGQMVRRVRHVTAGRRQASQNVDTPTPALHPLKTHRWSVCTVAGLDSFVPALLPARPRACAKGSTRRSPSSR